MTTVDVSVIIDRSLPEVYGFVADLRNEPKWWLGVSDAERLHGEGEAGTRYLLKAKLLGVSHHTEIEVVLAEPPHRLVISSPGPLPYTCDYTFTEHERGTEMRLVALIRPARPWGLLGPLLGPVLTVVMRKHLRNLDRIFAD